MKPAETQWLLEAADSTKELKVRIRAVEQLGEAHDPALIPELKRLLQRARPPAELDVENWDPAGAERVLDLHIIESLHRLGDDSEIGRVVGLVRDAQHVLQGPYEEIRNAITTVRALGSTKVVLDIAALAVDTNPRLVENGVRTLDALDLPARPVAQDLAPLPWSEDTVTLTIHRLKEELDRLVALLRGHIALSAGVSDFSTAHDYSRGEVVREDRPLAEIITREMRQLGFDYYVEDSRVVLCTYPEAGRRWFEWRTTEGPRLRYDEQQKRFVLGGARH